MKKRRQHIPTMSRKSKKLAGASALIYVFGSNFIRTPTKWVDMPFRMRYVGSLVGMFAFITGCCHFPYRYSADPTTTSAKAFLASHTTGEAYLGASAARFTLSSPVKCFFGPKLEMAPAGPADPNGVIHFGAFAVRHGDSDESATVCWWSKRGELRTHNVSSPGSMRIDFIWINDRTIRFQFGETARTIRLNEDDGQPVTEL